jgi:plasmid maintenance system antidote protein VapI
MLGTVPDMSDKVNESSGRTVSFWMSHEEVADLDRVAKQQGIKRNKAARRAVREYVLSVSDR